MSVNDKKLNILLIDNFDSFTYNLLDEFSSLGHSIKVVRNNIEIDIITKTIEDFDPHLIVISPGPGKPEESGICIDIIKKYYKQIPIFGVCLGHQCLATAFEGKVEKLDEIIHGKQSHINHTAESIFKGLANPLLMGRYHSLGIIELPDCFDVIARHDDIIMAIKHKEYPVWGVQFHPESILSPEGIKIIHNVIEESSSTRKSSMSELFSSFLSNVTPDINKNKKKYSEQL